MLLGLHGYAGSGKDTIAELLAPKLQRIAFADKIREFALKINPWISVDYAYDLDTGMFLSYLVNICGWEAAKQIPEVRGFLQNLGVAAREMFGENVWIIQANQERVGEFKHIITDVRFKNEAEWVKAQEGYMIRVIRTGVGPALGHHSESQLDNWTFDWELDNSGDVDELEREVKIMFTHFRMIEMQKKSVAELQHKKD